MHTRALPSLAIVVITAWAAACPRAVSPVRPSQELGAPCSSPGDCVSGYCVDGLCCDGACGPAEACNLPRSPGHCTARAPADHCGADTDCATGHCVAGGCCDTACTDALSACDLPRAPGTCTARVLGDPCAAAAGCASGFCVDGVCCDGACDGLCETCVAAGLEAGRCLPVPANTDPDHECGTDACSACSGRICAAATPGTDPQGDCGAGRACGAAPRADGGICAQAPGGTCGTNDDCAAGGCLRGSCRDFRVEALALADTTTPDADLAVERAVPVPGGAVVMLRETFQYDDGSGLLQADTLHLARLGNGTWLTRAFPGSATNLAADMETFGDQTVVVSGLRWARDRVGDDGCIHASGLPHADACLVTAQWMGPTLETGARELVVDPETVGPGMHACSTRVHATADGTVYAAVAFGDDGLGCFDTQPRTTRLYRRDATRRSWVQHGGDVSTSSLGPLGIQLVDGAVVLVEHGKGGTALQVAVHWLKEGSAVEDHVTDAVLCPDSVFGIRAASTAAGTGPGARQVYIGGNCDTVGGGWVLRWDPDADPRLVQVPVSGLDSRAGLVPLGGDGTLVQLATTTDRTIQYREESLQGAAGTGSLELARLYSALEQYGNLVGGAREGLPVLAGVSGTNLSGSVHLRHAFVILFEP